MTSQSVYMEWAKRQSAAKFTLATSGVLDMSWDELGASADACELRRPGGYGYPPLLQAIASRFGITEESVVTVMGTSFANHLVMAALLSPGDEVLIEHPVYEPILAVAQYLNATIKRFHRPAETGFQIDMDELQSLVSPRTRLIVVSDLHNPTSAALDCGSLTNLQTLAQRCGARILVDEVYLELRKVAGQALKTSFHLGPEFIVTSSLTKAYGLSGLRCGWILAEPDMAKRFWRLSDLYYSTPPHLVERLSVTAFQQLDRIAGRSRSLLAANRALLDRFLHLHASDLDVLGTDIGTVVFPRPLHISANRLCDVLRDEYETSVVPGRFFEMPDRFRLGIGGRSEIVAQGLDRLSAMLKRRDVEVCCNQTSRSSSL